MDENKHLRVIAGGKGDGRPKHIGKPSPEDGGKAERPQVPDFPDADSSDAVTSEISDIEREEFIQQPLLVQMYVPEEQLRAFPNPWKAWALMMTALNVLLLLTLLLIWVTLSKQAMG